jgi:alkanesulfonate monooxygenase SsuD/methylene tetrahydromethanopterin reductase-like flavin-dependent oxidoreductase (luciferase family)
MTGSADGVDLPRTGLVVPSDRSSDRLLELAADAADAGFDSVWAPGGWGYDPFTLLGRIAERTDCALGTCVANAFARSPAALAGSALALDEATDGRFVLGIGASTPAVVEGFHGERFDRPLRRIRETIEILDLALSGDRIDYDGDVFELDGFRLDHAGDASVPVLNAALGRTNVAMTIDHADGLLPHLLPLPGISDAVDDARDRARTDGDLHVAPSIPTAISDDPAAARDVLSEHVAFYVGSTTYYRDVVATHGFPDEAAAIHAAWQDGDRAGAADAASRDLLEAVGIAGRPEYARERLAAVLDGVADTAIVSFPRGATDEMHRAAIEALPPGSA